MEFKNKFIQQLKEIYNDEAQNIYREIEKYKKSQKILKASFSPLKEDEFLQLYVMYPDGVIYDSAQSPLENLKQHIKYIKNMGFNAVHILPFLESPMIDKGFDVSSFLLVDKRFGTCEDLMDLKRELDKAQLSVFMDLVFNHVSVQHVWFLKAQKGDLKYRNYFLYSEAKPNFIRKFYKHSAVWAEYEINNQLIEVTIAFPEYTGEIPHWVQGTDGYWYYHTYYPQQVDLNWLNPDIFIEIAKVVIYWCSLGFNFRLDALPFIGKGAYKQENSKQNTAHIIISALRLMMRDIHPECVFILETYENLETITHYFEENKSDKHKKLTAAYNFHLSTNIWLSLVKRDSSFIWRVLNDEKKFPPHIQWINFLRNHDELSFAHLHEREVKAIRHELLKHGKNFREKYGLAGRSFSFLGESKKRYLMAYFLLASLPGSFMLLYGDEIAVRNVPDRQLNPLEKQDTRNINRGKFLKKDFFSPKGLYFSTRLKQIFLKRKKLFSCFSQWPSIIPAPKKIYAASYNLDENKLLVYINLSNSKQDVFINHQGSQKILSINSIKLSCNKISLGPFAGVWLIIPPS